VNAWPNITSSCASRRSWVKIPDTLDLLSVQQEASNVDDRDEAAKDAHVRDALTECVFCKIIQGKAHGYVVGENTRAVALLDIQPHARGHCLIIPRRHVPWWHDLTEEENADLFKLARETAQKIMKAFSPEFVSMYARGRRIPHTHIFLVPTNKGEPFDRHFNALEGFQEAVETLASLRDPKQLDVVRQRLAQK